MDREFTHSYSLVEFTKAQREGCSAIYSPFWRIFCLIAGIISMIAMILGLTWVFAYGLRNIVPQSVLSFVFIPALMISIVVYYRLLLPRINKYVISKAKYEFKDGANSTLKFTDSYFEIVEENKLTKINWAAVEGVFSTKTFVAFFVSPLIYYVPRTLFSSEEDIKCFIRDCEKYISSTK